MNYFRFIFPNTFSVREYKFTFTFKADDVYQSNRGKSAYCVCDNYLSRSDSMT